MKSIGRPNNTHTYTRSLSHSLVFRDKQNIRRRQFVQTIDSSPLTHSLAAYKNSVEIMKRRALKKQ
jgi:hypothetical protein